VTQDTDLEAATERHRAGDLAEARRLYEHILASTPNHTPALFRSGLLELQSGRAGIALTRMQLAVDAAPGEARYRVGLGQALQAMQRWSDAALAFEAALRLDPTFHEARNSLGVSLQRSGHPARAAEVYRQALDARPGDAGVMANWGTALREMGALPEAVERLRAAAELEPRVASHRINLGIALCQQREFAAAEPILHRALDLDATNPEAAFNLGIAQNGLGRSRDAIDSYRLAAALRPGYTDAHINLGNVLADVGDFDAALSAYEAAIRGNPNSVVGLNNAGCLLRTLGRFDEAEECLLGGLKVEPESAALHDNLGNVYKDSGRLDRAIESYRRALELQPDSPRTHSNLAYALGFQSEESRPILEECTRWNDRFAAPLLRHRGHANDLEPGRRLRIGYVSADFRDHCQTLFTLPLLSHHDHGAFEIFCYSSVKRPDHLSERIAALADMWRDVRQLDDEALCALIREDRIDILVDLTMHMADGRPLVFARKPAPVAVAWLAYPGTTGITAIDYRLSDPRLDPDGAEIDYSERTLRLPDTFWCYDPLTREPQPNLLPALERGYLTLGCLNNACKLTDHTLRLWGAVYNRLPAARLLLMAAPGNPRRHLLRRLSAHGIASEHVDFTEFRPRGDYLRSYHAIDLGLDTFPYNGHTTSLDSFWMGVPVVTRVGRTCVGRAGLSQLHHLDLTDLACDTDEAFVETAVALGGNLARLSALRGQLRARMENSPLMDAARFTRHIEDAYRSMWRTYRASRSRSSC
jgi:predicted O-linked N-acetylglucosamine transferase (SPINDLY family)